MSEPVKAAAYTFNIGLFDAFAPGFKQNPTLAAGDVKISKDNGAFVNVTTLPTVAPAAERVVKIDLSAAEMDADRVTVQFIDQTVPSEWQDTMIHLQTIADLATVVAAAVAPVVNAEVLDVLNVDTFAEVGQEAPAATQSIRKMLAFLYKAWRNRHQQTGTAASGEYKLYGDDGTTVDQKATTADDSTTFTRGEIATGP